MFFDLFETLVTEFSEGSRISKRNYDYMGMLGLSNETFKKEWSSRNQARMNGYFPNYPAVLKDIIEKQKLPYNDEVIKVLYHERVKEKSIPFRHIRPDMIELLIYLKSKNLKLGLISNCTEEEVRQWQHCELAQYFDATIFSYEVGCAKPDPRIYKLACDRLAVEPNDSIFIGDGGSEELERAYKAGLQPYHAIWFNTFIESNFKKCRTPLEIKDII